MEGSGERYDGYVFLVDSTDLASFDKARVIYEFFRRNWERPHIITANKQDLSGAIPPDKVRALLKVPSDVPVVP